MVEDNSKKFRGLKFVPVPTLAPKVIEEDEDFGSEDLGNRGLLERGFYFVAQTREEPIGELFF